VKFGKIGLVNAKPPLFQNPDRLGTTCLKNHVPSDNDRVADKTKRFPVRHRNRIRNILPDHLKGVSIKGGRIVQDRPVIQRGKTGIEMVKPPVHKFEGENLNPKNLGDPGVSPDIRAKTITREKDRSEEKSVPCSFEEDPLRKLQDLKTFFFEPLPETHTLRSPLRVTEPGKKDPVANRKPGIGGKDHIRKPRHGGNQINLNFQSMQDFNQPIPLSTG